MNEADRKVNARMREASAAAKAWLAANEQVPCCDFCANPVLKPEDRATYLLDEPFQMGMTVFVKLPEGTGTTSLLTTYSEDWMACPACAAVIEQGDRQMLVDHVLATADVERIGVKPDDDDGHYTNLYANFFARNPRRVV